MGHSLCFSVEHSFCFRTAKTYITIYLELNFLTILQSHPPLSPVEEMCIIYNITTKLREIEHTGVVVVQLVVGGLDEVVTETRLACSSVTKPLEVWWGKATNCHSNDGHLSRGAEVRKKDGIPMYTCIHKPSSHASVSQWGQGNWHLFKLKW